MNEVRGITWRSQQSKNVPFLNRSLLEKTYFRITVEMGSWHLILKLAILAKEDISTDTLHEDPPDKVTLPTEHIHKANVESSTVQNERDCKTRNEQLKNTWLNKCKKIELVGILCGNRPWKFCGKKLSP